ncbi:MAG: peptide deformylase [Treponema sp.]
MNILYLGEESLRHTSQPVTVIDDSIQQLVQDMFIAMEKDKGIGLAAPQVGKNIRLFIVKIDDGIEWVFINPQIIGTSAEQTSCEEGCLSIPSIYAPVIRPAAITVQYQNMQGKHRVLEADGLLARVIQHEYDHLEGILFIDRLPEEQRNALIAQFEKRRVRKIKHFKKR